MTEKLDKALGVVFNIMKVILIVLILAMVGVLIAHIVFRYILNNSLTWSEELLKILLVWFGMLSEHVAIVVFKNHMPKKLSAFWTKFTQGLTVVVCLLLIFLGFSYCASAGFRLTPALRIPYLYAYLAIPVGFIFVTLFEIRNFIVDVSGKGKYECIEKPEEDLTGGKDIEL